MPTAVFMPKFEMTQETGTVVSWLKNEGDLVQKGEPLLEVETDKAVLEVESPATGILAGVSAAPGQVVPIATPIAYILKPGESLGASAVPTEPVSGQSQPPEGRVSAPGAPPAVAPAPATPVATRLAESHGLNLAAIVGTGPRGQITREDVEAVIILTRPAPAPATPAPSAAPEAASDGKVAAVPAARRLAREVGIDLGSVSGTGPEGRIQSEDVRQMAEAQRVVREPAQAAPAPAVPTPREGQAGLPAAVQPTGGIAVRRLVPLTKIRRTVGERMTASVREAPQFSLGVEVAMGRALRIVEDLKPVAGDERPKITLTALVVKACAWALRRHPEVNASFQGDQIVEWDEVNVGVATAIDQGLIVPVVRGADGLGLRSIAAQMAELTRRARDGKARLEDLQGGTFTVSNLGMFGIDHFTAILNPPQAAILTVGRVAKRVQVGEDDEIETRPMASLALTADHRVLDGATAARFLQTVQRVLEHPGLLLDQE